jgi:4-hydroxy-2-oxoheptanedioate aldolase
MRVGSINESDILRAMDIGVHGLQIPNIDSKNDVMQIIKYAKYPPIGERGFSPFTRSGDYSTNSQLSITEFANKNTLIGVNIESDEAIKNLDAILQVEELDIVFIGLFDLSKSMGIPGDVKNPRVQKKLEKLTIQITDSGKYPGTIATDSESLKKYENIGIKYILYLVDCMMIKTAYQLPVEELDKIRH